MSKPDKKILDIVKNIEYCDKQKLDSMSHHGSHQGIIAEVESFRYASMNDIPDNDRSLVVVLDHIVDAGNLGAIIRSADAVGADAVIIPKQRAASITAATYKSSAGAVFNIPVIQVANLNQALEQLKSRGYWSYAASEHTDTLIWDADLKGKVALIMGAEHDGVSPLVLKNSDFVVKLPIDGKVESLNVAQAATACMYEWARQNA